MAADANAPGLSKAKVTPQETATFLDHLREMPNVSRAARLTGRSRNVFYEMREEDPDFSRDWDTAVTEGVEHLEEKAWARAEETSDVLAMFLLRAHKPRMYRERLDVTSGDETLQPPVTMIEVVTPPSQEEVERAASDLVARQAGLTGGEA